MIITLNHLREKEEVAKVIAEAEGTDAKAVTLEDITTDEVEMLSVESSKQLTLAVIKAMENEANNIAK